METESDQTDIEIQVKEDERPQIDLERKKQLNELEEDLIKSEKSWPGQDLEWDNHNLIWRKWVENLIN